MDSILRLDFICEGTSVQILHLNTEIVDVPGFDAKYTSANISVMRSICCDSPGNLKLSSISLIAWSMRF